MVRHTLPHVHSEVSHDGEKSYRLPKRQGERLPEDPKQELVVALADLAEMAEQVFARLQDCRCHSWPVVRDGRLIGIITPDNATEFLMIQEALRGGSPRLAPA